MEERTSGFKPVKKKKGGFNLVDLLLVLFAVIAVLVVVFLIDPFSVGWFNSGDKEVTLEYDIRIDDVDEALIEKIRRNDEVVDAAVKTSLGYVIEDVKTTPHKEYYYDGEQDASGKAIEVDCEGRYDLLVTVSAKKATFTEGEGYKVNGRRVAVGARFYLMFPDFVGTGTCTRIE